MMNSSKSKQSILLTIITFFLVSCGAETGLSVVDGGISGTGITMGRITQFGSIYVNGIRFDVDSATFTRDGAPSTGQTEFSIGEYVIIKGKIDATGTKGLAEEVVFNDSLEGAVTLASTDSTTIEVLGRVVETNQLTQFHGFAALADLVTGNIVEVSGLEDANGVIQATSIKLKQETFIDGISQSELKGQVSQIDLINKTLMLDNILVDYSSAELKGFDGNDPQNDQFVEVKSNATIVGNTMIASSVELDMKYQEVTNNIKLELEGVVTRFNSILDFDVNGIKVTTTSNTEYKDGTAADVTLNAILEVEGIVNDFNVLVADKIEIEYANNDGDSVDEDNNDGDSVDEDNNDGDSVDGDNNDGDSSGDNDQDDGNSSKDNDSINEEKSIQEDDNNNTKTEEIETSEEPNDDT